MDCKKTDYSSFQYFEPMSMQQNMRRIMRWDKAKDIFNNFVEALKMRLFLLLLIPPEANV